MPYKIPSCPLTPLLLLLLATLLLEPSTALENGLARTPPMGWLAWERFTCETDCDRYPDSCIHQRLFEAMGERMVKDHWLDYGYEYVNIDDCWTEYERDPTSDRLVPDRHRFPAGIQKLAHWMHERGLKLGVYGDCGTKTCGGYPAQLAANDTMSLGEHNYFATDASAFASWQVDSFKFDGCYVDPAKAEKICPGMIEAIQQTGRQILITCEWPFYLGVYAHQEPRYDIATKHCNIFRYADDISDSWHSVLNTVDYTVNHQRTMVKHHGPGHWFDPDQLVVGNFGLSPGQARAQMALWCLWSAPLYMSNDLRKLDAHSRALLQNAHLIAVDQDPLGVMGLLVCQSPDGQLQAFVKPVAPIRNKCPSFAIVYLNRNTLGNRQMVSFNLRQLLLDAPIFQAALHQRQVLEYQAGVNTTRTTRPKQLPIEPLDAANMIHATACIARLAAPTEPTATPTSSLWGSNKQSVAEYDVSDLLEQGRVIRRMTLDERLTLFVDPSSVRAVKLVEVVGSQ